MLNVYAWNVCPHCRRTVEWLKEHKVPFQYLEIEEQPKNVIQKVIEVNGGDDWVVPTLEYKGQWRPGQVFDVVKEKKFREDLFIRLNVFQLELPPLRERTEDLDTLADGMLKFFAEANHKKGLCRDFRE